MSDLIRSNIECNFLDEFINEFKTTKINNVILTHPNNEHHCSYDILFDISNNLKLFIGSKLLSGKYIIYCSFFSFVL